MVTLSPKSAITYDPEYWLISAMLKLDTLLLPVESTLKATSP
jgi:hypothetical protein